MRHPEEPKSTADFRNGENPSNLLDRRSRSLSPVHFTHEKRP